MRISLIALLLLLLSTAGAQTIPEKIKLASDQLKMIEQQRQQVMDKLEVLKLESIQLSLDEVGLPALLPGDELVKHAAYSLAYVEKYEQARWVAHIILPDVMTGSIFRTNDFRVDEKVKSGSAEEADYFLKKLKSDSTYEYDAFGYDRGHLAPSADFRWSRIALSESYYYSNMSPQLADFNRGSWGDLEDAIRGYIYAHPQSKLYVVTGPVLTEGLPVIERGKNKVAIPKEYFKIVADLENKKGIAFLMPNRLITEPLKTFASSIDAIEKLTGLDFFNKLPLPDQATVESQTDAVAWLPAASISDVEPLAQEKMERNHFNTTNAKQWMGQNQEIHVCGTVVGARLSKAGNVLINLDKQFPNQVFTIFVKKEHIVNFNYDLVEVLKNKVICGKGKLINQGGTPTMYIETQNDLSIQ
jgi:endonuclease G